MTGGDRLNKTGGCIAHYHLARVNRLHTLVTGPNVFMLLSFVDQEDEARLSHSLVTISILLSEHRVRLL